jgi:hypothetical protein
MRCLLARVVEDALLGFFGRITRKGHILSRQPSLCPCFCVCRGRGGVVSGPKPTKPQRESEQGKVVVGDVSYLSPDQLKLPITGDNRKERTPKWTCEKAPRHVDADTRNNRPSTNGSSTQGKKASRQDTSSHHVEQYGILSCRGIERQWRTPSRSAAAAYHQI